MLTMDRIHDIRNRFYVKGEKIAQIAKVLNLDWKTVQNYVDMLDFNNPLPKPAMKTRLCPKLDPFKAMIDKWLEDDTQECVVWLYLSIIYKKDLICRKQHKEVLFFYYLQTQSFLYSI